MTEARIDPAKIERLLARVRREVDEGLSPAAQIAIGHQGELVVDATFGAPDDSRFVVFSATKGIVAGAFWQLLDDGRVKLDAPVAEYLPQFNENGKESVTVEQVLTHTGGFPYAPLGPPRWDTRESRLETFARWRLNMEPGKTFMYHPTSGHWVLAEILAEVTGQPYAEVIQATVTDPLGLPRLLAIPHDQQSGIVESVAVGQPPTPEEMREALGIEIDIAQLIPPDVGIQALLTLNQPDARALGVPGGGGVMRAADLARYYQALLHNPAQIWSPEILAAGTADIRITLPDMWGMPANRTLGLVVAGDDDNASRRGFGRTASPRAFGHNGAGGQLAFADPASGLSVAYVTAGMDQHILRQYRRDTAIASLAADLLVD